MQENLTELVFILDKSGSMFKSTEDTIGGFNAMIAEQKQQEGQAVVSTILFSSTSQVLHDRKNVGRAIHHIKNVHKYAREEDRPAKTLFVITTDGMENASREYTHEKVRSMIEEQEKAGCSLFLSPPT